MSILTDTSRFPRTLCVSGSEIAISVESDIDLRDDPRGVVWMYEPPIAQAHYIMGMDPSVGITNWSRGARTSGDHKTDNGAIQIFRVAGMKRKLWKNGDPKQGPDIDPQTKEQKFVWVDVQAAEYFAPVDAVEIARVANALGRMYAGDAEDQCELIFEAYPGPGLLTMQELLRLGYGNLWMWEYIDSVAEETNRIGWRSSMQSQRMLWYRARRHLMERRALIFSPWLLNEYSNAVIDPEKMRAKAAYGSHDDLIQAANMAFWAGHKWTYDPERTNEIVTTARTVDWQNYAPGFGDKSVKEHWQDLVDSWE